MEAIIITATISLALMFTSILHFCRLLLKAGLNFLSFLYLIIQIFAVVFIGFTILARIPWGNPSVNIRYFKISFSAFFIQNALFYQAYETLNSRKPSYLKIFCFWGIQGLILGFFLEPASISVVWVGNYYLFQPNFLFLPVIGIMTTFLAVEVVQGAMKVRTYPSFEKKRGKIYIGGLGATLFLVFPSIFGSIALVTQDPAIEVWAFIMITLGTFFVGLVVFLDPSVLFFFPHEIRAIHIYHLTGQCLFSTDFKQTSEIATDSTIEHREWGSFIIALQKFYEDLDEHAQNTHVVRFIGKQTLLRFDRDIGLIVILEISENTLTLRYSLNEFLREIKKKYHLLLKKRLIDFEKIDPAPFSGIGQVIREIFWYSPEISRVPS